MTIMTLEVFAPAAPTPQKTFTPATDSFCQIFGLADIAALSQLVTTVVVSLCFFC